MLLCSSQNTWWSLQAAPAKQVSSEDEDEQFYQAADSQEQEHSGYGWLGLSRRRRTSCMLAPLQPSNDPHAAARVQRQRRREASKPQRQRAEALQAMIQQMSLHFQEVRLGLLWSRDNTRHRSVSQAHFRSLVITVLAKYACLHPGCCCSWGPEAASSVFLAVRVFPMM